MVYNSRANILRGCRESLIGWETGERLKVTLSRKIAWIYRRYHPFLFLSFFLKTVRNFARNNARGCNYRRETRVRNTNLNINPSQTDVLTAVSFIYHNNERNPRTEDLKRVPFLKKNVNHETYCDDRRLYLNAATANLRNVSIKKLHAHYCLSTPALNVNRVNYGAKTISMLQYAADNDGNFMRERYRHMII